VKHYEYHDVKLSDQSRIRCTGSYTNCGKPATMCQHVHWDTGNTKGLSFFYYCPEHDPRNSDLKK
jgi:hypothetical protein